MKKHNVFNNLQNYETYHSRGCGYDSCKQDPDSNEGSCICLQQGEWTSPSDLIIDLVDLKPPLTSKITRGKTHIGIQSIGETYLEIEKEIFYKSIMKVLKDNDDTWKFILKNEIKGIHKKVKDIFKNIFEEKRTILVKEMSLFYEKSLKELEEHVKLEVKTLAYSFKNGIIDQLNKEIEGRLKKEKYCLEKKLNDELTAKIDDIKMYYDLLLDKEKSKYIDLKNKVIQDRNDAIKSFYRQVESEKVTSIMYVLSSERKKCKVKKMLLENIQYNEIMDQLKILVKKDELLKDLEEQKETIPILNRQWEEEVVKILRLFLKFISFSLKLLPEQTTFLMDFEKMVILQLNEILKQPYNPPQILMNKEEMNIFQFHELKSEPPVCDEEPFKLVGSLESPLSLFLNYGSKETIGSEADFPYFRVQRRYVYAKCHGFEEIKEMLGTNICRCKELETILGPVSNFRTEEGNESPDSKVDTSPTSSKSTSIHMGPDLSKVNMHKECPDNCQKSKQIDFTDISTFLDFNEKKFNTLKASANKQESELIKPVKVKDIVFKDVPFPSVEDDYKTVGIQCSSEHDIDYKNTVICECARPDTCDDSSKCKIHNVFLKREQSLKKLLKTNPKLFSVLFSDETYDSKF